MGLATRIAFRTGQKAVWWSRTGDDATGAGIYAAPVQLSVRWEDRVEEFISPSGETLASRSIVYPEQMVAVKDLFWLGELADLPEDDPALWHHNPLVFEVRGVARVPNMRGTEFLKVAYL